MPENGHGHKNIATEEKRRRPDDSLQGNDDAAQNIIQSCGRNRRFEDGRQDHDDDDGVDEHAGQEIRYGQNEHDADGRGSVPKERRQDHVGDPSKGNGPGKGLSHGDQDEDYGGHRTRAQRDPRDIRKLDGTIDEVLHQKGVEDGHRGSLRRTEHPGVYSSEDDDGEGEAEDGPTERQPLLGTRGLRRRVLLSRFEPTVNTKQDADEDPGTNPRDEQIPDGGASHHPIDDYIDAGGYEQGNDGRIDDQGR